MPRILLIDDEEQIRLTYGALLKIGGHEVVTAVDGEEALALFRRQPFDLVITDVVMPRMGGAETIAALRRLRPSLKVIAVYGGGRLGEAGSPTTAQSLGADRLLTKPFMMDELQGAVAAMLNTGESPPA